VALDEVDGNGLMGDTEQSPTPGTDMFFALIDDEIAQDRWPTS
jgi:hypothetical protein